MVPPGRLLALLASVFALVGAAEARPRQEAGASGATVEIEAQRARAEARLAQTEADAARAAALSARRAAEAQSNAARASADHAAIERALMDLALAERAGAGAAAQRVRAAAASALNERRRRAAKAAQRAGGELAALQAEQSRLTQEKAALAAEQAALAALSLERRPSAGQARGAGRPGLNRMAPVRGRVLRRFGERFGGARSYGIAWSAPVGAPVVAPADGRVSYAAPFRDLGPVLILDLDGGSAVILMGVATAGVTVGSHVLAGEPLGVVRSKTGATKEGPARPRNAAASPASAQGTLYMEVRRAARPVDPERWLADDPAIAHTASRSPAKETSRARGAAGRMARSSVENQNGRGGASAKE